jgi:hypothetical protein
MEPETEAPPGMPQEDWQRFLDYTRAHPFGDQDENGIDLSLLRANLKLTPTQRIEKMRMALRLVLEIERDRCARLSRSTPTPD